MRRFFVILTALALVAHATLGCCWHHAHACEAECCADPAAFAGDCDADHHSHELAACESETAALGKAADWPVALDSPGCQSSHSCESGPCVTEWRQSRQTTESDVISLKFLSSCILEQLSYVVDAGGTDDVPILSCLALCNAPCLCVWRL